MNQSAAYARWYTETLAAQRRVFAQSKQLTVPTLFLVSGDDALVDPDATRVLHDSILATKRWRSYPDAYHELFQELDRERVFSDIADWLDAR